MKRSEKNGTLKTLWTQKILKYNVEYAQNGDATIRTNTKFVPATDSDQK